LAVSIIVCSKNKKYLADLSDNISKTIGCEYELIYEDNSFNNSSIASVYNKLAYSANYPNLIFIHEDVRLHSYSWGKKIIDLLEIASVGLIGLMGSVYKSKYPSAWASVPSKFYRISGQFNSSNSDYGLEKKYFDVSVVDGCFMAIRKDIFNLHKFDEYLLGFHAYDIDLSLNVVQHLQVIVPKNIRYSHFSKGNQNSDWVQSYKYIHEKWQKNLPSKSQIVTKEEEYLSDYLSIQNIYNACYQNKVGFISVLNYYLILITKYFSLNKLKYTKKTFKYLFSVSKS
jgi:hypothetical protein